MTTGSKTTKTAEAPRLYTEADGNAWRTLRTDAAKVECAAEKEWQKTGEKGERPSTPNLDHLRSKADNGGVEKTTKRASRTGTPRAVANVRYNRRGVDVKDSMNKLSTIAYFFTGRIASADSKRLGAQAFRALLVKLGVDQPETSTWSVELPNGEIIGATVNGEKAAPVAASTIAPPAKKAAAKKAAPAKTATGKAPAKTATGKAPAKTAPKTTAKKSGATQVTPRPKASTTRKTSTAKK